MMTLIKCFSVLVASGNAKRCNDLRSVVYSQLVSTDEETGKAKTHIFKYGKNTLPTSFVKVASELTHSVDPLLSDVDDYFFCNDKNTSSLKSRN